jgi:myosin V
MLKFF